MGFWVTWGDCAFPGGLGGLAADEIPCPKGRKQALSEEPARGCAVAGSDRRKVQELSFTSLMIHATTANTSPKSVAPPAAPPKPVMPA